MIFPTIAYSATQIKYLLWVINYIYLPLWEMVCIFDVGGRWKVEITHLRNDRNLDNRGNLFSTELSVTLTCAVPQL